MANDSETPWQGRTRFGQWWACFEGECGEANPHRHLAAQMIVASSGSVTIKGSEQCLTAPAIFIRANALHSVTPTRVPVRMIYVRADSPLACQWSVWSGGEPIAGVPSALSSRLRQTRDVSSTLDAMGRTCPTNDFDPRLSSTLDELRRGMLEGGLPVAAARVGLSASRLRTLAAEQLDAPLAQWRLWSQLESALGALSEGATLAQAAVEAGFSDQAHLCRTMRRFMGVTPKTLSRLVAKSGTGHANPRVW